LEILVDLGLLGRRWGPEREGAGFVWESTPTTHALALELREFTETGRNVADGLQQYLDRRYFASMARALTKPFLPVPDYRECLRWFALAYEAIGREFGFTPGRTLALKAC
jgi:hypothetical protein